MSHHNETTITSQIDATLVQHAESQIYQILLKQRLAFNQRWQQQPTMNKIKKGLRYIGLILSIFGFIVMLIGLFSDANWSFQPWQVYTLMVFFAVCIWFFFRLPKIEKTMQSWTQKVSEKSCRKLAKKSVKQAQKQLPFKAIYEIKGRLISYYRQRENDQQKDQHWQFVWNRKFLPYAIQAPLVTVFFKQQKGFIARIIVLHENPEQMKENLERLGIETDFVLGNDK